jgi:hypothetical protein
LERIPDGCSDNNNDADGDWLLVTIIGYNGGSDGYHDDAGVGDDGDGDTADGASDDGGVDGDGAGVNNGDNGDDGDGGGDGVDGDSDNTGFMVMTVVMLLRVTVIW